MEPVTPYRAQEAIQVDFEPDKKAGMKEEFMRWHIHLNHILYNKFRIMVQQGMMASLKKPEDM